MRWGVVFLFAFCVPAAAQNPQLSPSEVAAFDKLLTEYSVCAAYLSIVEQCFPKDNAEQTEKLAATIRAMTGMAEGGIGNNAGLLLEARRARIRASYEAQSKSIGGSCSNITALWEKHSARCNQLDEHPDQVFDEYLKK